MKFRIKKTLKTILFLGSIVLSILAFTNWLVKRNAEGLIYDNPKNIPFNKVGLVLGAGKYTKSGHVNTYYKYRIDAVVELYNSGKIQFILISGDNSKKTYDEPTTFKTDLIAKGIPADKIYLDYAGFRTLDSVIRAKEIFGLDSITFVSQKFHNERAIYLANNYDIHAIGYNAKDGYNYSKSSTRYREYLARTKATIDVLFNVDPKFLGDKIEIK